MTEISSLAVMQPYFFPYIGYFQLIKAADQFIFRDDVQFNERGWIHRNRLLVEGKAIYLTIPCPNKSKYEMINNVEHLMDSHKKISRKYLLNKVSSYYHKAPFFDEIMPLIQKVINLKTKKIADIAIESVKETCRYLSLKIPRKFAANIIGDHDLGRTEALVYLCKFTGADTYINAPGGKELYTKNEFREYNITLKFLEPGRITYPQFGNEFIPRLSIIDVMMFNPPGKIKDMLSNYTLK